MAPLTQPRSFGVMAAASVILLIGLALLWMAVPRTIAYTKLARGDSAMAALARGNDLPLRQVQAAISSRRDALAWTNLPDAWISMGSLYLALARRDGLSQVERLSLLDNSISSFGRGLSAAPSRPFAWLQLAQAHHLKNPTSRAIEPHLRMSILTGPHEPGLIRQRVRLGFAARTALSPETASHISEEVRLWAANDPWRLADWARPQFAMPWIRQALKGKPNLDRRFVVNYLRLPPR